MSMIGLQRGRTQFTRDDVEGLRGYVGKVFPDAGKAAEAAESIMIVAGTALREQKIGKHLETAADKEGLASSLYTLAAQLYDETSPEGRIALRKARAIKEGRNPELPGECLIEVSVEGESRAEEFLNKLIANTIRREKLMKRRWELAINVAALSLAAGILYTMPPPFLKEVWPFRSTQAQVMIDSGIGRARSLNEVRRGGSIDAPENRKCLSDLEGIDPLISKELGEDPCGNP